MEELCAAPDANSREDRALSPVGGFLSLAPAWAALAGALSASMPWDGASVLRLVAVVHEGKLGGIVSERDFLQVARELFEWALEREHGAPEREQDTPEHASDKESLIPS